MAYPTKVKIRSGKTVYAGDPDGEDITSRRVEVSVTYALERSDDDLLASVARKAQEVEAAHLAVWRQVRREQGELALGQGELALGPANAGSGDDGPPGLADGRGSGNDPGPPDDPRPDDDDPLPSYARDEAEEKDEEGGFVPPSDEVPFTNGGPPEDGPVQYPADRNTEGNCLADNAVTGNGAAAASNGSVPRPVPVTKPQKLAIEAQARRLGLSDVALAETIRRRYSKTSHTARFAVDRLTKKEGEDLLRALAVLEPMPHVPEAAHP